MPTKDFPIRRPGLLALGLALMLAAAPFGFVALLFVSAGEMMISIHNRTELLQLAAVAGLPSLLFLAGVSLVWASGTGRYRFPGAVAALILIDLPAAAALTWRTHQPDPPPAPDIAMPPRDELIPPAVTMPHKSAPPRLIVCAPKNRNCESAPDIAAHSVSG